MSGSQPDVIIRWRLGPRESLRRHAVEIGSEVSIWFDVINSLTGELVPGATGASAVYWIPQYVNQQSPGQPVEPVEETPGSWRVRVLSDLPGAWQVRFSVDNTAEAALATYYATTRMQVPGQAGGRDWGAEQALATAAGESGGIAGAKVIAPRIVRQEMEVVVDPKLAAMDSRISALEYVPPVLTALTVSPSVAERGASVPSVVVTIDRNRTELPVQISGAGAGSIPAGASSITLLGPWTSDATFTATVTDPVAPAGHPASDSRQATLAFRSRRYWGVLATDTPTDADILSLASEFATALSGRKSATLNPSNQYVVYAQPADWPIAASVTVGAVTTTAFTDTVRTLVNASGAAVPYRIRVLTYPLSLTEEFIF